METLTRHWRGLALALVMAVLAGGCDPQRIDELEEGVATEADVRARFGEPVAVYPEADGAPSSTRASPPATETT